MLFIPIPSYTHDCSPLPIEEVKDITERFHSQDKARYDVRTVTYKMSQCPVCGKKYSYDKPLSIKVDFEPYAKR